MSNFKIQVKTWSPSPPYDAYECIDVLLWSKQTLTGIILKNHWEKTG